MAYEAKNMQGDIMFCGVASIISSLAYGVAQETMVEAALEARNHGFLSSSRSLAQIIDKKKIPDWQEKTMIADLKFLHQNGLTFNLYLVSKVVLIQFGL